MLTPNYCNLLLKNSLTLRGKKWRGGVIEKEDCLLKQRFSFSFNEERTKQVNKKEKQRLDGVFSREKISPLGQWV